MDAVETGMQDALYQQAVEAGHPIGGMDCVSRSNPLTVEFLA